MSVVQCGDKYTKQIASHRCDVSKLVNWTLLLRDKGVPTPALRLHKTDEVIMRKVCGQSVRDLPVASSGGAGGFSDCQLQAVVEPLLTIHQSGALPGLKAYDPFWRIVPRLGLLSGKKPAEAQYVQNVFDGLQRRFSHSAGQLPETTLHGDYHVGQLILGEVTWVLDLEDICRGPAEADVANFCAHIATSPSLCGQQTYFDLLRRIGRIYAQRYRSLDCYSLSLFGCIALLRRYLKRLEAPAHEDFEIPASIVLRKAYHRLERY